MNAPADGTADTPPYPHTPTLPQASEGTARFPLLAGVATLVLLLTFGGWRAWVKWGPVPERPLPPGAKVRQWSVTTCGPACVATLLNLYGRPWTPAVLELECRVTSNGASLYDLRQAARGHGLCAEGLRALRPQGLLRVPRPFIAYLSVGHFVVVERFRAGRFEVFDPTSGAVRLEAPEDLYARGGGWVLSVTP